MKSFVACICCLIAFNSNAQLFDGVETLLLAKDDSEALIKGYTQPLVKSLIYGLNAGWATSAKTHSTLGFDLSVGLSASITPKDQLLFSPKNLQVINFSDASLPTVFGDGRSVPLTISIPASANVGSLSTSIDFPGGIGDDIPFNAAPLPHLQLGIGTIKNTDLLLRGMPTREFEGAEIGLFGIGLKHDLTQYMGLVGNLPLNVSVLVAQTHLNTSYAFRVNSLSQGSNLLDNSVDFKVKSQTFQLLGSLDFPIISVFGALGVSRGKTDFDVNGVYELSYIEDLPGGAQSLFTTTLTNPLSIDYTASSLLATLGTRLNLALFKIYAQYSIQEFKTFTIGTAFNFR